ncbi:hypothetical protein QBC36DRAFT_16104 [Triangularia setosa]|uniref:Uncharacterized protein n=1 Tax=Triangularia setosa TaxID=2587417 RepID=A0AAN7A7D3_9PEZI|nr:hypothetical protein QBC36DRAFT_16104 [Podospora setosa]
MKDVKEKLDAYLAELEEEGRRAELEEARRNQEWMIMREKKQKRSTELVGPRRDTREREMNNQEGIKEEIFHEEDKHNPHQPTKEDLAKEEIPYGTDELKRGLSADEEDLSRTPSPADEDHSSREESSGEDLSREQSSVDSSREQLSRRTDLAPITMGQILEDKDSPTAKQVLKDLLVLKEQIARGWEEQKLRGIAKGGREEARYGVKQNTGTGVSN